MCIYSKCTVLIYKSQVMKFRRNSNCAFSVAHLCSNCMCELTTSLSECVCRYRSNNYHSIVLINSKETRRIVSRSSIPFREILKSICERNIDLIIKTHNQLHNGSLISSWANSYLCDIRIKLSNLRSPCDLSETLRYSECTESINSFESRTINIPLLLNCDGFVKDGCA